MLPLRFRRGACLTLLLLGGWGHSAMAAPPDAATRARLDELARAYKALSAYADRGTFTMTIRVGDSAHTINAPASIALERPNRIRVETVGATVVSDGTTLTTVVIPTRKYATEPAPKSLSFATVALGPVGSLMLGGPSGPPMNMVLGLLLADDGAKAVLDQGETLATEPDRAFEGTDCSVLRLDTVSGATYRLLVDKVSSLVRAVEVTPDPKAIQGMFPPSVPVRVEAFRWTSGPIAPKPAADAFAAEMPRDFAKVATLSQPQAEKAARPDDDTPKFQVQALVNKPAPKVSLTLLDGPGKTRSLTPADFAGKVVVIDFWATWCGPCLAELPEVQKLIEGYNKAKKDVVIIALSQDNDPKDPVEVRKLIETTLESKKLAIDAGPVGRVGLDPSNSVGEAFKVEGYPTVVILDGKGTVSAVHVGYRPEVGKALGAEIDALLEGKPLPRPAK